MSEVQPLQADSSERRRALRERLLRAVALLVVLALIVVVFLIRDSLPDVRGAAYGGIFVLTFIGSASILLPVPGILAVYWGGDSLNPVFVGLLAGLAEGLGEVSGYLVGFSGSGVVQRHRLYGRVRRWMEHRGGLVVFLMASFPNPVFDIVGLVAGGLRFPVWRFFVAVWLGKTIKNLIVAMAGALSLPILLRLYEGFFG